MDLDQFNLIVLEHRNSMIVIGCIILFVCIATMFVIEFYVRGALECKYFQLGKIKISPTLFMLIPMIVALVYFSVVIVNCNKDISANAYETYIGICTYESESVNLKEAEIFIYVGKGHEIVPHGDNYGKCIYSKYSKVIVHWESLNTDI